MNTENIKTEMFKPIDYIGIDVDSSSIYRLLKTIWQGLNLGLNVKKVSISPSGHGFHLLLGGDKEISVIEDLITRALLNSDEQRLRYSIKRLAISNSSQSIDILFDRKKSRDSVDITRLIDLGELRNIELEDIEKMKEKYEKIIKPLMSKTFVSCFAFNGEKLKSKLETVCEDITKIDKTFRFRIYENFQPNSQYIFAIITATKDLAFKKSLWFLHKVFDEEDMKSIITFKSKGKDNFFWVKERKKK